MLNYTHTSILYILFENNVYYVNYINNNRNDNNNNFDKLLKPRLSINKKNILTQIIIHHHCRIDFPRFDCYGKQYYIAYLL